MSEWCVFYDFSSLQDSSPNRLNIQHRWLWGHCKKLYFKTFRVNEMLMNVSFPDKLWEFLATET